jgi:hypothetical protein
MNDGARIGYSEFVAICNVDDPRDFSGFRLELDGLYVAPPRADDLITPKERATLSWHPTGDHSKPALPLPCTLMQLRTFVAEAGLLGCIDEDEVDALPVVPDASAGGKVNPAWAPYARKIGEDWMHAEEKRNTERPTVEAIAKHVEGELSTRGITGVRGKFLDWETIKREALTGITGRKKGDNFKTAMGNPQRKRRSLNVKA